VLVLVAVVTVVGAAILLLGLLFDGAVLSRGDAATEQRPPSERGIIASTTLPDAEDRSPSSVPAAVDEQNRESSASRSGATFAELECTFEATSTLEPSLPVGLPFGGGTHRMGLEDGATFACSDGTERSAGTISLDATFDQLNTFNGVTSGTGSIDWTELAPDRRTPGEATPSSTTAVEIQLDYPVIVVWTTILDGPFAGYRGRLVLRDWEQLYDASGDIEGIRFATTSTTFGPI
jgi:hypothetical protein